MPTQHSFNCIPVSERLPKKSRFYYVIFEDDFKAIGKAYFKNYEFYMCGVPDVVVAVTHWLEYDKLKKSHLLI